MIASSMPSFPMRPPSRGSAQPGSRQRGFSLLETALVVLLVGSAIAAGFLILQAQRPVEQVRAQEQALQWADQALVAYAAQHARLPCAVATPTSGTGDCVAAGQKGWLPVRALEAIHPGGNGPGEPVRYMVYRGASGNDADLAVAVDRFNPSKWDGTKHAYTAVNGLDLCLAIANAARETASAARGDRTHTTDIDGHAINVAYGLSAAGPTPGNSGRYDGLNQAASAVMESPGRGVDSGYDDRVRVRDFNSLARSLGCGYAVAANPDGLVTASLDMLALSVDVSDEVEDQHQGNIDDTTLAVGMAAASEVFAAINVALSAANIANSSSTLATASSQLSAAIASCAVLVGCALIPPYTGAVIAAGIAIGLSATATALGAVALGLTSAALAETIVAKEMADKPIAHGPGNLAEITEQTCLAADGGYRLWDIDADGKRFAVDPPGIYQKGLKQELEEIEQEIVDIQNDINEADTRLSQIEAGSLPGGIGSIFNLNYGKPVKGKDEKQEDYDKRYQEWFDGQDERVKNWEQKLQAKLAAIRKAEDAHVLWDKAKEAVDHRATELGRINTAVVRLRTDVDACDASPPATIDGQYRCSNKRNSLEGLLDCSSEYTTVDGDGNKQCVAAKQQAYDDALQARTATRDEYGRLQDEAINLPSPEIHTYWPFWGWDCLVYSNYCNRLIIRWQQDDDDRETYARTYYGRLHLVESLALKKQELVDKQAAYEKAHKQCEALRNMTRPGGSGVSLPVWGGPDAILEAANCRGATGPVQPTSCEAPVTP